MYFQKQGARYSFIYYDSHLRKNVRLKRSEVPGSIRTEEEAEAFCRRWDAKADAFKVRLKRRKEWRERFHDFNQLIENYEVARKEEAPNSFEADVYSLEYYVLPFFLEQKQLSNINLWASAFEDFRDYLLRVRPLRRKKGTETLAYATKNNIIKALNAFLKTMHRRRHLEIFEKCRYFPKSKVNRKDETSVMSEETARSLFFALKEWDVSIARFFLVSLRTGLRLNEMLGLSLGDFFSGAFHNKALEDSIRPYKLPIFGYLALESQPRNTRRGRARDPLTGRVDRKPLKGKKRICHEDSRIIPIFDRETFNFLVEAWNAQQILFVEKRYGENPRDYLLFGELTKNSYSSALRIAQRKLKFRKLFTPHDTRHTYSTWLAEVTGGNYTLCRMILGHQSLDITMRYVHLSAQIYRSLSLSAQLFKPMEIASAVVVGLNFLHNSGLDSLPEMASLVSGFGHLALKLA